MENESEAGTSFRQEDFSQNDAMPECSRENGWTSDRQDEPRSLFSSNSLWSRMNDMAVNEHEPIVVPPTACGADIASKMEEGGSYYRPRMADERTEGVIKLNIPNLSNLRSKVSTSYHYIANLPWRLAAKTEKTKRTSDVKFFSVYIDCNPESESTLWSCDALVEFRLVSQRPDQAHFSRQFTNKFNYNSNNWGFPSFMEWNEIVCAEKGFAKHDRVSLEAKIVVQKVIGVRINPRFEFLSYQPNMSDVVLLIDGKRLNVSKMYLGMYSPVFHAMFFSNFIEREKREIPVEDVMFEEFLELLNVIYPSHKPVSAENVEFLLELGDKFEIQYVMDVCEKFLMTSESISTVTKLVWADQYYLAKLQDCCLQKFKTVNEIKSLKQSEEYKNISDVTKAALLEKIFKLHKE